MNGLSVSNKRLNYWFLAGFFLPFLAAFGRQPSIIFYFLLELFLKRVHLLL